MATRTAKLSELEQDRANANKGTERGRYALEASLRKYGAGRSILIDRNGRIIAGNKTAETAADVGIDDVIVVQTDGRQVVAVQRTDLDLDSNEARELAYADNRVGQLDLDFDPAQILADLNAGVNLDQFWRKDELDELLADLQPKTTGDTPAEVDRAEELRQKWGTAPGQLWQLGEHRLICGDCTDPATVARVMGGERAAAIITDPPYALGDSWQGLQVYRGNKQVANDDRPDWDAWFVSFLSTLPAVLADNAVGYFWYALRTNVRQLVEAQGYTVHAVLIWVKEHYNVGRADYHSQYEPCLYFSTGKRFWCGRRDISDVWNANRIEQERLHPTQKPLSLIELSINNSTESGAIVYEPFDGSGTCIIACENTNRRCRAIEIDAGFVAVALERWSTHTGKTPVLIG